MRVRARLCVSARLCVLVRARARARACAYTSEHMRSVHYTYVSYALRASVCVMRIMRIMRIMRVHYVHSRHALCVLRVCIMRICYIIIYILINRACVGVCARASLRAHDAPVRRGARGVTYYVSNGIRRFRANIPFGLIQQNWNWKLNARGISGLNCDGASGVLGVPRGRCALEGLLTWNTRNV